jgi:EmrB/QacA subfamily drug resistance transporter
MVTIARPPCDEGVMRAAPDTAPATLAQSVGPWVLGATILGSSMAFINGTVVNVALPAMQRDLGATSSELQWIVQAYALFLSALILVGGSLGDHLGRKRVYAAGVALFTLASVACGLAPGVVPLIMARAVQGIGGALLVPGSLAIISATYNGAERGRAIGTWSGFTTVTSALGPVLGGWLVQTAGWRWIFFLNVPLAIVVLFLAVTRLPESRDAGAGPLDWWGALCATLGLGGLVFGLIEASSRGFGDPLVFLSIAGGVVALALFIVVEACGRAPMLPLDLFRSRTFAGTNLLTLLLYGALGGALYWLPFNLQQAQGYSAAEAGAALLPFTAITFALSRWAGGLVGTVGARLPLVVGPLIAALGFVLFALPDTGGSYWTTYFPAAIVLGLGMVIVIAPLTTTVMNAVEQRRAGVASGVNNAVARTAGLLAVAVLGIVVTASFAQNLAGRLDALSVAPAVRHAIEGQRSRLAGTVIPSDVAPAARAQLKSAVVESFVGSFRVAMLIGAGLAVASAVSAVVLVGGTTEQAETEEARQPTQA